MSQGRPQKGTDLVNRLSGSMDAKQCVFRLSWLRPGAVWAMDFTKLPCANKAFVESDLLLLKDLGSDCVLETWPLSSCSAENVMAMLRFLFAFHGAPLVLKADNGPAFIDHRVLDLLRTWNVKILYSPVGYPQYNGSCERSVGLVKENASMFAAGELRSHAWTLEDVLDAKHRLNRLEKTDGLSARERFENRTPLTLEERETFLSHCRESEQCIRKELGIAPGKMLNRTDQAFIDRRALPKVLVEDGFLFVRRRLVSPPIKIRRRSKIKSM